MGLGTIHLERREAEQAGPLFARALRLNPDLFAARRLLGNSLMMIGRFDEAVQVFEAGVQRDPQSAEAHFYLGKVLLQRGRFPEAERELEFAVRTDPNSRNAWLELARLYSLRAEVDRSLVALRRADGLGFQDVEGLRQDPDFDNLFGTPDARAYLDERAQRRR